MYITLIKNIIDYIYYNYKFNCLSCRYLNVCNKFKDYDFEFIDNVCI